MSFQFTCPGGHLLEGDEAHIGQQCQSPICGVMCVIPAPPGVDVAATQQPGQLPQVGPQPAPETVDFDPHATPDLLHIPCPNGHELETPLEMLGQDVLCPHCGAQFHLRRKDSIEYKRKREQDLEQREHKLGKAWLNWAVVIAVLVLLGLILIIATSSGK